MIVRKQRCRNSVFCVLFVFWFLLGTICGVLLFQVLAGTGSRWIVAYCDTLFRGQTVGLWSLVLCWSRPLLFVGLLGVVPWGRRILPTAIFLRGALTAYSAAAWYVSELRPIWIVVRGLTLLPLYYAACRFSYFAFASPLVRRNSMRGCEDTL